MSVEIEPSELGFRRPFTVEVSQILKLRNSNKTPVAFKVKTTAPKQYCVRPNSGRIEPGHEVDVTVLLQAMKQDPAPDVKCRDKFLVQSVPISSELEFSNVQTIWDSVEKSAVQERKIRVIFLPAGGADHVAAVATPVRQPHLSNGVGETPPPSYQSPEEHRPTSSNAPPSEVASELRDDPDVTAPLAQSPVLHQEEPKREFATPKEQEGLRQRKGVSPAQTGPSIAEVATSVATRPQGTEGVPIQIVAVLCLVSFLLAYFFF